MKFFLALALCAALVFWLLLLFADRFEKAWRACRKCEREEESEDGKNQENAKETDDE